MIYRISITKSDSVSMPIRVDQHDLLLGLARLHILHQAAQHPIYSQWMIAELGRHGCRLSPGTLYPMLSKFECDNYLSSTTERDGRTLRQFCTITDVGRESSAFAKIELKELAGEVGT
jgi:PadR family transcriptional regulator, regulatory protein PadR